MPSTYTSSGIELIGDGEQSGTWGATTNSNLRHINRMVSQAVVVSLAGTTHTLTVSDGGVSDGHYGILVFGGAPSGTNTVTISPNDAQRMYFVKNDSGHTVIIRQGSGSTVTVPTGRGAVVYSDGAGSTASVTDLSITFASTLATLGITATASELNILDGATLTTAELNILDGATVTASELNILDGATLSTAELNTLDGFTGTFEDLNYAKDLRATGVTTSEFDILDGLTVTTAELNTLTNIPALGGNNGKAVVVNSSGTALEYQAFPEGTVYTAGAGLTLVSSSIFTHADTSTQASVNNSGATVLQSAALDDFGHVTTLVSATLGLTTFGVTATASELNVLDGVVATTGELNVLSGITATTAELNFTDGVTSNIQTQLNARVPTTRTVSAGAGLTGGGALSANISLSHADTSSQSSVSNSGVTFIQSVVLDTYGHVTGLTSATAAVIGTNQTWKSSTTSATNGSGRPIMVAAFQAGNLPSVVVGGLTIQPFTTNASGVCSFIVPNGVSYTVTFSGTPGFVTELS